MATNQGTLGRHQPTRKTSPVYGFGSSTRENRENLFFGTGFNMPRGTSRGPASYNVGGEIGRACLGMATTPTWSETSRPPKTIAPPTCTRKPPSPPPPPYPAHRVCHPASMSPCQPCPACKSVGAETSAPTLTRTRRLRHG